MNDPTHPSVPVPPPDDQLLPVLPEREQLRRSCGNCQGSDPAHVYGELVLCWSCADRATCPECGRIDKPLLDSPAEACGACQDDDTACPCGASPIVGLSHGELVCGPCFKDHQAASAALSGGRYHPVAINPDGQDDDTAPGVTR